MQAANQRLTTELASEKAKLADFFSRLNFTNEGWE
jgi:hypothetical protein